MYTRPTKQEILAFIDNKGINIPNIQYLTRTELKDYLVDQGYEYRLIEFTYTYRFINTEGLK